MNGVHEQLRRFLHTHCGICLGPEKNYLIDSRLPLLLRQHGLNDGRQLLTRLHDAPRGALASAFISAMTTHETFWFRDPRAFDAMRQHLLPQWRARAERQLRIWSAASSSGQEIYSVAMLLAQEGFLTTAWDTQLLASDICLQSLQQAREGRYNSLEMERGLPPALLHRHFQAEPDGWRIDAELRRRVRFEQVNLLNIPAAFPLFDAIFCRNVLIYFDQPTQAQVLEALHARLSPGGWLFLGPVETLTILPSGLFSAGPIAGLYRKAAGA